jgi:phosphoribosyl 1,2-cyclic phosphodiesterase
MLPYGENTVNPFVSVACAPFPRGVRVGAQRGERRAGGVCSYIFPAAVLAFVTPRLRGDESEFERRRRSFRGFFALDTSDFIKFLGTAGARFVVLKQLRSSAGTFLHMNGHGMVLDPGPGTLARCAASRPKIKGEDIDAVILTHSHIDHSTDVNVMIELMADGGFKKRGVLFATQEALWGDDPVVLKYVREFVERIETLEPDTEYSVGTLRFRTHGKHHHTAETYGLTFSSQEGPVSFIVDTLFFPKLCEWYAGSAVLVINLARMTPHKSEKVMHLCYDDARTLISSIQPRLAVITHFGMTVIKARPWEVAKKLSEETGVDVVAASDGKTVELGQRETEGEQVNIFE